MVRYNRMKGRPTLWLPGTDHAGIATQVHFPFIVQISMVFLLMFACIFFVLTMISYILLLPTPLLSSLHQSPTVSLLKSPFLVEYGLYI